MKYLEVKLLCLGFALKYSRCIYELLLQRKTIFTEKNHKRHMVALQDKMKTVHGPHCGLHYSREQRTANPFKRGIKELHVQRALHPPGLTYSKKSELWLPELGLHLNFSTKEIA